MATIKSYETAAGKRYRVRYRKPDGSQTDKRGFKTKKEAELFSASVEVKKATGEYIDPAAGRVTVATVGAEWITTRSHLKPSSVAAYESAWRLHVKPKWGDHTVGSIRPSEVQAWVDHMSSAGDGRKAKSPTIVRRAHDILAGILDSAMRDNRVPSNAARGANLPRRTSRPHVYLTHEQVAKLATACGEHALLVTMLAYTGLRWGEVTALRVRDVNQLRRRLHVIQNAVYVNGRIDVGTPKTHKTRTVPYPGFLAASLKAACVGKGPDDLVFPGPKGDYFVTPTIKANSWWDRAAERIGAKGMTIHDLRHTAASLAISAGAHPKAVQRMLGHASAAMTLDVYADLFEDDLDAVAERMGEQAESSVGKMWASGPETKEAATS